MHVRHTANSMQEVATEAERLAGEKPRGKLGLVFQGITAVSLGAITAMNLLDMIRDSRAFDRGSSGQRHR
jgi:hypothetical protein